ncbi:hypothetical protein QA264_10030 [Glaesserella parasuis]|uniref:Uncharacterized protein n=3 Tax=Glaesserella parasuis TaxID=738 RepID=A0AAJ6AD33_GLAPU|nr:sulfatase domain protein [Glaesserella parasuis]EPZ99760.1 sulfatase domain protein [Glaesserella parasuis SW114]MDD2173175.1 hypothetical protein [Glaesserella parasuis]MDE3985280.1 hypothetical protein [Glaesserella parasuis]MDE4009321.1 hypothetical protein [Glaesserella parasuis]MDE4029001.1 hypothetical protein [Glaesserella parasuis]
MFRLAQQDDLTRILEIYNQVIERRTVTADLVPATKENRQTWFNQHLNHAKYPIWVYELDGQMICTALFWAIYILIFAIALIGIVVGNFYYYKTYNNYYDMLMFGLVEDDTKAVLKNIYDDYPVIS